MGINDTLGIARTGIQSHQSAIQTVARNIANQSTPGYARQRAVFSPIASVLLPGGVAQGGGSQIIEVDRVVDQAVQDQLQRERARLAFAEVQESGLSRAEDILQSLEGASLSDATNSLFRSLNDLAADPGSPTAREAVVQSAQALTSQIQSVDLRISQLETDLNESISRTVTEVNSISREIVELNGQIRDREFISQSSSELRDRRDQLLEELGQKIDFTSFERADGTVTVFVAGGFLLTDGLARAELTTSTLQPTPLAQPNFVNVFQNLNGSIAGPITSRVTGGELGALISLRDDTVQELRQQVDRFAFSLADRVNTVHAAGRGLVDDSSRNLFVDRTAATLGAPPGAALSSVLGAAQRIGINPDILANGLHLAAGTPAAGAASSGDNTNALALASLQSQSAAVFDIGDPPGGPASGASQTLTGFLAGLTGALGADLRAARSTVSTQELVVRELESRRDATSGVSVDEEISNLVRYQRGFEANARVLSTVDELLGLLLQI